MKIFGKDFEDKRVKKFIYTAVLAVLAIWFVYRFVMVAVEWRMDVFNPIRATAMNGILVDSVVVHRGTGTVEIPLDVKNNRAYVAPSRRGQFKAGQKIGAGEIISVSSSLDLDSGMYVVRIRGVDDGLNMVSVSTDGLCVPAYAVRDGVVMIVDDGVAVARNVRVENQDSSIACVSDGLNDGDRVILSKVASGAKVRVEQ
ncbi:MAG: hypothetical protein J6T57_00090 [Alphaproteobacteria bacterium]|nr:hypothetical protein [Alphaproteobacteria bacterium]